MSSFLPRSRAPQAQQVQEDIATGDLGGAFPKGGHVTSADRSTGFASWIAELSADRILTSPVCRHHDYDGAQGLGLWRPPHDPALPSTSNDDF